MRAVGNVVTLVEHSVFTMVMVITGFIMVMISKEDVVMDNNFIKDENIEVVNFTRN